MRKNFDMLRVVQALDKMEDVEDVEDEAKVTISLPEPGPIGRPIVQVKTNVLENDLRFVE